MARTRLGSTFDIYAGAIVAVATAASVVATYVYLYMYNSPRPELRRHPNIIWYPSGGLLLVAAIAVAISGDPKERVELSR